MTSEDHEGSAEQFCVIVPALGDEPGDSGSVTFATEDEARRYEGTVSPKWTHGNPTAVYRRTVTDWQPLPSGDDR